jgi:hypothetical protein
MSAARTFVGCAVGLAAISLYGGLAGEARAGGPGLSDAIGSSAPTPVQAATEPVGQAVQQQTAAPVQQATTAPVVHTAQQTVAPVQQATTAPVVHTVQQTVAPVQQATTAPVVKTVQQDLAPVRQATTAPLARPAGSPVAPPTRGVGPGSAAYPLRPSLPGHTQTRHRGVAGQPALAGWVATTTGAPNPSAGKTSDGSPIPIPHLPRLPIAGFISAGASGGGAGGGLLAFAILLSILLLVTPKTGRRLRPALALGLSPADLAARERPG